MADDGSESSAPQKRSEAAGFGVVPVFPLPDHVVFPGVPTPYRLFEPRYCELATVLLEKPATQRRLAIPRLAKGWRDDYEAAPRFELVATVGRAAHLSALANGQFQMVFVGEDRVLLDEVESPYSFRLAYCRDFSDVDSMRETEPSFDALVQAVSALAQVLGEPANVLWALLKDRDDPRRMVFMLASALVQDASARQRFLASRRQSERIDMLLEQVAGLIDLTRDSDEWHGRMPQG
ncbi:MAG: LON peptidase substrate-binding domain-containing protein [Acidobacteriota bacterium]